MAEIIPRATARRFRNPILHLKSKAVLRLVRGEREKRNKLEIQFFFRGEYFSFLFFIFSILIRIAGSFVHGTRERKREAGARGKEFKPFWMARAAEH